MIRHQLESLLREDDYARCWTDSPPPYPTFLDAAAAQFAQQGTAEVDDLSASIRPWGRNRIRIDGKFRTSRGPMTYFVELVWLPRANMFRGHVSVYETPPEPEPKSVDQFIAALNAIVAEHDLILYGQAHLAAEGVDEKAVDLPRAYPAVFALFERFPEEDFGAPGVLVHMLEARGGFDAALRASLLRRPSIPAVTLAQRRMHAMRLQGEKETWLELLKIVAANPTLPDALKPLFQSR